MSYGKEIFRGKYKKTMDSLNIIKDNYYDLDQEYQIISEQLQQKENIIKEVREYIINNSYESGDTSSMYLINVDKLLEILDKGSDKE